MGVMVLFQVLKYFLIIVTFHQIKKLLLWAVGLVVPKRSPLNKTLQENWYPVGDEIHVTGLTATKGAIPEDIDGMYCRIGPNAHFPVNETYNMFTADGMVHGFNISGGKLDYNNRWVRTEKWRIENEAKRSLEEPIDIESPDALFQIIARQIMSKLFGRKYLDTMAVANTALEGHAGRVFALIETAAPTWITLPDLKTVGPYNYEGALTHNVTAHTKVDPENGNLYIYGYRFDKKPYCEYSVVAKDGKLLTTFPLEFDTAAHMHDFAITEHYGIIMHQSLQFIPERMIHGKSPLYMADEPCTFCIFDREAPTAAKANIRKFEAEPGVTFHFPNAYEDGDEVVVHGCRYRAIIIPPATADYISTVKSKYKPEEWNGYLYEWRFNLKTGKTTEKRIGPYNCELPAINNKYRGRKYQYTYCVKMLEEDVEKHCGLERRTDAIIKYDLKNNTHKIFAEAGYWMHEPTFIPKKGSVDEDDGYVVVLAYTEKNNGSSLLILDAKEMTLLAEVVLPRRVPYGFHGRWFTRQEIESQIKVPDALKL